MRRGLGVALICACASVGVAVVGRARSELAAASTAHGRLVVNDLDVKTFKDLRDGAARQPGSRAATTVPARLPAPRPARRSLRESSKALEAIQPAVVVSLLMGSAPALSAAARLSGQLTASFEHPASAASIQGG